MSTVKEVRDVDPLVEEIANSVTHGVGLGLSLAGFIVLLVLGAQYGDGWHLASFTIYGTTLVVLYTASTLYHSLQRPRLKHVLRVIDHSAIYLLIAGTYTPFALVPLRGDWGWMLLGLMWTAALAGVVYKVFFFERLPRLETSGYVALGWVALLGIGLMASVVPTAGLLWLLAGGLFYSGGIWFYANDYVPYNHAIWHLFVLLGSICHYFAVLFSALPAPA